MIGFREWTEVRFYKPKVKGGNHKQIRIKMFSGRFKSLAINSPFNKNVTSPLVYP
jgi:hypothetical protein